MQRVRLAAKVRNASIRRTDLAPSARLGSRGVRGPAGPSGDRGPAGFASAIVRRRDAPALMGHAAGPGKDLFMGNVTGATHIAELTLSEVVDRGAPSSVVLACKHLVTVAPGIENPRVQGTRLVALPAETIDVTDVAG